MAGSRKGKNKKKKEKSNPQKSDLNKKQIGISNTKSDLGNGKEGGKWDTNYFPEDEVERQLYLKIEAAYKEACKIIWGLGYDIETAKKALLSGGFIVGEGDILSSIMKNSLTLINSSPQIDGKVIFDKEPIFEDMTELIKFWIQMLVDLVERKKPGLPKSYVMQQILSSKSLSIEGTHQASSSSDLSGGDKFDFDALLHENVVALKRMNLTYTPELASDQLDQKNDTSFINPQEHHQSSTQSNQHSSKPFEFAGCYDETNLEEWLRNSSEEQKHEMILNLEDLIGSLEQQVKGRKEWAMKKARETFARLQSDTIDLNMLRLEKEDKELAAMEKEELATSWTRKILKKEIDRRKENRQLDYINERLRKLEAENEEIRADLTAIELNESESKRNLKQAMKKEKEDHKKIQNSEKHISKAQVHINEEKEKILQLEQELKDIEEAQREAKLKFKQEMEEKEQARILVLEEKTLTRIARENASRRLTSLQHELDMEHKLVMDHKERLMQELSNLKISQCSSPVLSSGASQSGSSRKFGEEMLIPAHRRCIVCLQQEVSVLFIPCAHQVVCYDCSANVGEFCPSCHVLIAKQYRVYGGNS